MRGDRMKLHKAFPLLVAGWAFALVACSSSSTAATSPPPSSSAATQTSTPSSATTPSAAATTLDPCQLVTSQEASSLTGVTYGAGTEETYSGGSKGCDYGGQTLNVFQVLVAQAPDAATAQADWAQEQAQAQSVLANAAGAGITINLNSNDVNVSGADKAAVATGSYPIAGRTFNVSVIYVIKGAIFFTFSDLAIGVATPSASAMEAQAQTTIGRLP
jgi:uncharacterized protein DUF3558